MNKKSKTNKYYISTFGCQMNFADSERFAGVMKNIKFEPTDDISLSDVIILNSCSVRQKAEDRISGLRKKMEHLKSKNPKLKIILTGCMARRYWKDDDLGKKQEALEKKHRLQMPWIDIIIQSKDFGKLPKILGFEDTSETNINEYLSFSPKDDNLFHGYLPISTGCDHFCTFCIVPYARGNEICREYSSIVLELENMISRGYKDITLLGQTVNRWINPKFEKEFIKKPAATYIPGLNEKQLKNLSDEPKDFLQLLQSIDELPGEWWFNFMSSHPNYMTKELIDFLAKSKHFRPYLHFALQSGSDRILKRMNRRHTISEFIEKTKYIKDKIPNIAISTDVIVGFPGESESDFQETVKVMKLLEFDMAFIAEFSSRSGTGASILPDDVPHHEKERRKKYLNDEVLMKTALKNNKKMLNRTVNVLIDHLSPKMKLFARTDNMKEILITNSKDKKLIGTFQTARVTKVTPWALEGELGTVINGQ